MADTWLEGMQDAIIAKGFAGLTSQQTVVLGPPEDGDDVPDFILGLVDRPGPVDETYGATYLRPNVTLVLRSEPLRAGPAYLALDEVFKWLTGNECVDVDWGGFRIQRVTPMLSPGRLRLDGKRRTDLTAEVSVWRDEL